MTNRILCRYCNQMVGQQYMDSYCPNCGKIVHSQDGLKEMITIYVMRLKREKVYDRIVELIRAHITEDATEVIRNTIGAVDEVIEPLVIEKIANSIGIVHIPPAQQSDVTKSATIKSAYPITLVPCKACGQSISRQASSCPHCGHPTGVHVCPKCGSTNTQVITNASKAFSTWLWGSFAANKVVSKYECRDCWHKF